MSGLIRNLQFKIINVFKNNNDTMINNVVQKNTLENYVKKRLRDNSSK